MMKEKRQFMDELMLFDYSQVIMKKVVNHPRYKQSHCIGIYVSFDKEVQTHELIRYALKEKRVCVPRIEDGNMNFYEIHSLDDLKEGHFHILEPTTQKMVSFQEIDCMIVPMLAFDHKGYRVGYGKGYYDRYFHQGFQGYKLGIAFSFQEVDLICCDEYDVKLDEVITQ